MRAARNAFAAPCTRLSLDRCSVEIGVQQDDTVTGLYMCAPQGLYRMHACTSCTKFLAIAFIRSPALAGCDSNSVPAV